MENSDITRHVTNWTALIRLLDEVVDSNSARQHPAEDEAFIVFDTAGNKIML